MKYWLIKSEGDCYSIDDFKREIDEQKKKGQSGSGQSTKGVPWTGVRNFQARNYMRDGMKIGDLVLYYHSQSKPTGVYGIAKVVSAPHLDATAKDPNDEHYEPKSEWVCVDMDFVEKFDHPVSLEAIKREPQLRGILVAQTGQRLSVMPMDENHFKRVVAMGKGE